MPFLPPNQQCQSTEGNISTRKHNKKPDLVASYDLQRGYRAVPIATLRGLLTFPYYTHHVHTIRWQLRSPCGRGLERRVRHTETTGRRQCASGTRSSCSVPLLPTARPSSMSLSLLGINGSLQRTQLYSRPCTQLLVVRSIDTHTHTHLSLIHI